MNKAYLEGYRAYLDNKLTNPYQLNTDEARSWSLGWFASYDVAMRQIHQSRIIYV